MTPRSPSDPYRWIFTPGPTALHPLVPDELRAALADGFPSESHRSPRFRAEVEGMVEALRGLLGVPEEYRVLVVGSATEAMERIVAGVVRERSAHLLNGAFARRFRDIAANLGRRVETLEVTDGKGVADPTGEGAARVLESGAELLTLTQNETSTGARIPPDQVHAWAERARKAGMLVAADLVSGWPTEAVDPAALDAGFFSVQKGFGLPAGLGIIVASPALVERATRLQREGHPVGGYLGIPQLAAAADRHETRVTPNMLAVRLLRRVAEAYAREGREALARQTETKAESFWDRLEKLEGISPFVAVPAVRSRTILVADVEGGSQALRKGLRHEGFQTGGGYGPWKARHLRVANFPVQTPEMMSELLAALERLAPGSRVDG